MITINLNAELFWLQLDRNIFYSWMGGRAVSG